MAQQQQQQQPPRLPPIQDWTYQQLDLWGGAATVQLPAFFLDASQVRPVPDHQECFTSALSGASIIFEILERVKAEEVPTTTIDSLGLHHQNGESNGQGSSGSQSRQAQPQTIGYTPEAELYSQIDPVDTRMPKMSPQVDDNSVPMACPAPAPAPASEEERRVWESVLALKWHVLDVADTGDVLVVRPVLSFATTQFPYNTRQATGVSGCRALVEYSKSATPTNSNDTAAPHNYQQALLLRLAQHDTDLLITINIPYPFDQELIAYTNSIAQTFQILDWSLFG